MRANRPLWRRNGLVHLPDMDRRLRAFRTRCNGGLNKDAAELTGFDRAEVAANGWFAYPVFCRLTRVAPLNKT